MYRLFSKQITYMYYEFKKSNHNLPYKYHRKLLKNKNLAKIIFNRFQRKPEVAPDIIQHVQHINITWSFPVKFGCLIIHFFEYLVLSVSLVGTEILVLKSKNLLM